MMYLLSFILQKLLDIVLSILYHVSKMQFHFGVSFTCFRACKGFDGGFEVVAAIRRHRVRCKSKYKR